MDDFLRVITSINKVIENLAVNVPKDVISKGLPPALDKINAEIATRIESRLPHSEDTVDAHGRSNKSKQSKAVKDKFKHHMKDRVRIKMIRDAYGVLSIVGVDQLGKQVNFDYGPTAKSTGRKHILWGKRPHNPPTRVQRQELQDIPDKVMAEIEPMAETIIRTEVGRAIQQSAN